MTNSTRNTSNNLELALDNLIKGITKEDLNSTKHSLKELTSQKNAYTPTHGNTDDPFQRWNMITYKNGKKSSL